MSCEQYNARKSQLQGTPKMNIGDVETEIQRVRSSTPKPVSRTIQVKDCDLTAKKVAYKHELEDMKKKVETVEMSFSTFEQTFNNVLEQSKKDLALVVDSKVEENKKVIESFKIEGLKTILNESIAKMNDQLKTIASQLVSNGDSINELKTRIADLEALF